ncbi:MAG: mitochondrial fission ELM1 family protein [Alphaproteobacteria bacterium]|nr:mitochondrial fission ELM1 family protein [Alphaproteobacteria bacterium]
MSLKSLTCWILTEGLKGTENQCLGVAQALGIEPLVKHINLKQPWKALSPYLGFEHGGIFTTKLESPWPDILLTSGRKSIAAAKYIKKASGGKTFCVYIQDPKISPKHFDLVALPQHDRTRGPNVITTLGAPNLITEDALDDAREEFAHFESIRSPRLAVLIGGNSKSHTLSAEHMHKLCEQLKALDAGLMITASRRTGAQNLQILQQAFAGTDAFIWDNQGPNPYLAMLGWADYILVTEDSVSMTSDAATTGTPVYTIPMQGGSARLNRFHQNMQQAGITRIFDGTLESWSYPALEDAQKIAFEIERRLKG